MAGDLGRNRAESLTDDLHVVVVVDKEVVVLIAVCMLVSAENLEWILRQEVDDFLDVDRVASGIERNEFVRF